MKHKPTVTANAPPFSDDDLSLYFDLLDSMPRRRHSSGDVDDELSGGDAATDASDKKRKTIAHLLNSLVALEEQESADRLESDEATRCERSMMEENHRKMEETMGDYYHRLQDQFDAVEEAQTARTKRARATASVAAAGASANAASASGGNSHHQRRLWVKDRSRAWWDHCNSPEFSEEEFRKAFRMGRKTFEMICEELGSSVAKEDTMLRAAIPVRQRVAVCLWRLATGEPLRLVSKRFGLGISTCHKLVLEVCSAIRYVLMPRFVQWPDGAAAERIKEQFKAVSGIPDVIGSMYTTHVPIIAPKISVGSYFNRRHTERNQKTSYSITVQGVVNPEGVFTDVCIGWPGSMPDDQVLEKSALYQRAAAGMLKSNWIVGSSGYPLMDWVLVPYDRSNLTWTQHAFNEKIREVQGVSREAFMRLKGRWSCLQKRTEVKLQDLPVVLGACCVLHNICELSKEEMDPELKYQLIDDEMVPENSIRSADAARARDSIAHNLLHHGLAGTAFF